jgi:zinc protease
LQGQFLSKHFHRAFRLFVDCVRDATFEAYELTREKGLQLQEIRTRDDHPGAAVFDLFNAALYRSHPYGLPRTGSEASLGTLDRDALLLHRKSRYPLDRLCISVVGDVDETEALKWVDELLGPPGEAGEELSAPARETPPEAERHAVRYLDRKQAHLVYGFLGTTLDDLDRFPLEVLATVLSGQGGRLFVELRDKQSLAYSVNAFSLEGVDPGYFAVYIGTSGDKVRQALAGIRAELAKVCAVGISADELDRAKRYLIGSHQIGLQRNAARAAVLATDFCYGLGAEAYLRYPSDIEAVTRAAVLAAARRYLLLDRPVVAALGPVREEDLAQGF